MKSKMFPILVVLGALVLVGCDDDDCIFDPAPAAPQGVYSITGDNEVYLYWYGPYEADIVEFIIWRSDEPIHGYEEIGRRAAEDNPELHLWRYEYIDETAHNDVTYFYAVSAVDLAGQDSDLSAEVVKDTPRPEGEVILYDVLAHPDSSGFHFATATRIFPALADVYVDSVEGIFFLNAANDSTDLQDMGYTDSLDNIDKAPLDGWSNLGWVEIILGHMYVIWTKDFRYAKMRVESINEGSVTFAWAYQRVKDNPELAPGPKGEKPVHATGYLSKDNKSTTLK
jgi:hypothetical protein